MDVVLFYSGQTSPQVSGHVDFASLFHIACKSEIMSFINSVQLPECSVEKKAVPVHVSVLAGPVDLAGVGRLNRLDSRSSGCRAVVLSMSSIAADIDNNQILFPPPAATCVLVSSCPSNASMQP